MLMNEEFLKHEEQVPIAGLSTFKVGGMTSHVFYISNQADLISAVSYAHSNQLEILVVGGGSNILFSDDPFLGALIVMRNVGVEVLDCGEYVLVTASAGENWDQFVKYTIGSGYYGLENLSLIPGSVGASVVQNIGAYGVEVGELVDSVSVFDTRDMSVRKLSHNECCFGYRNSLFKSDSGKDLIVMSVTYRLPKTSNVKTAYKDFAPYIKDHNLTPEEVRDAVIEIRSRKFPDLSVYGTAGSFWKNIICDTQIADDLKIEYPDLPVFDVDFNHKKISTAFVLDKICGLRGYREGNVGLFKNQSLVVVNYGNASSSEIKNFVTKIKNIVKEKIKINLEEEVVIIKK